MRLASIALSKHLVTLYSPSLISPQNGDFTPTAGQTYYSEATYPMGRYGLELNSSKQATWLLYEVSVHVAAKTNKFEAFAKADEISNHFERGLVLTEQDLSLEVFKTEIGMPLEKDAWYVVPVLVYVRFYA